MSGKGLIIPHPAFGAGNQVLDGVEQLGLEVDLPAPAAGNVGSLELRQLGEPAGVMGQLDVKVVEGGRATDDGRGASFAWRPAAGDDTAWRGWLSPQIPLNLEQLASAGTFPSAVGLDSGRILVAWGQTGSVLKMHRIDSNGTAATTTISLDPPSAGVLAQQAVGLVAVPGAAGQRVLAVVARARGADPEPEDQVRLTVLLSEDEGETWQTTVEGAAGWSRPPGDLVTGLRVAYYQGHLVALVEYGAGSAALVAHLVSADLGASWTEVGTADASIGIGAPHPCATPAGLLFLWLDGSQELVYAPLGSPYEDVLGSAATLGAGVGGFLGRALSSLAVGLAEDGRLLALGRRTSTEASEIVIGYIDPRRLPTNALDPRCTGLRGLIDTTDDDECLMLQGSVPPCVALAGGRALLVCTAESQLHPFGGPVYGLWLGGYSSIDWRGYTYGVDYLSGALGGVGQAGCAWLPISSPSTWAGLALTSATTTVSFSGAAMRLQDSVSGGQFEVARQMNTGGTGPFAHPRRLAYARVRVAGGPTVLDFAAGGTSLIGLRQEEYQTTCELAVTKNAAAVIDREAGVVLGSIAADLTEDHELLLMLTDTEGGDLCARGWIRRLGDQAWIEVGGGVLAETGSSGSRFKWGHLAADATGVRDTYWGPVYMSGHTEVSGTYVGGRLLQAELGAAASPDRLSGRPLTAARAQVADGRAVAGRGGVAVAGDQWAAGVRWAAGAWRVDPAVEPSPAAPWRTDSTGEQLLEWQTGPLGFISTSIAVSIVGSNVARAFFEVYDVGAAAWVTLITCDRRSIALNWQRRGNVLYGAAGGEITWLDHGELEGSWLDLGATHGVWRVSANREGAWSVTAELTAQVELEGDCSALPSSGSARIIWRDTAHLVHDVDPDGARWRLRLPSGQRSVGGVLEVGVACIGDVAIFGAPYEWGRQQAVSAQVELVEASGGQRRAIRRGAPRRRVDFSWEALDERRARAGAPVVVTPAGGRAVAADGDPGQLAGLLARSQGALRPLVYLPALDLDASEEHLLGPARLLYGRMIGPVTRRTILGEELLDEVQAIDAITIEEEV
jgi:hypothetical protein